MLELTLDCATLDTCSPALSDEVQRHLGHLLAEIYAQDRVQPSITKCFAALLTRLEAAFDQAHNIKDCEFQRDLLAKVPSLHRFALSLTRNPTPADDLLQNTLLRAWRSRTSFAPGTNLEAWLFTIMRNQFYSAFRNHGREVQDEDGGHADRLMSLPEQGGHLDLQDVHAALDRLLPVMRQALVLVAIENLTYDEAATVMNCRIGTVKSRVWRAREQLAQMLGYTGAEIGSDGVMLSVLGGSGEASE